MIWVTGVDEISDELSPSPWSKAWTSPLAADIRNGSDWYEGNDDSEKDQGDFLSATQRWVNSYHSTMHALVSNDEALDSHALDLCWIFARKQLLFLWHQKLGTSIDTHLNASAARTCCLYREMNPVVNRVDQYRSLLTSNVLAFGSRSRSSCRSSRRFYPADLWAFGTRHPGCLEENLTMQTLIESASDSQSLQV